MHESLFSGPYSLRDPHERIAFWATAICAFPAALAIGFVLHESIGASQVALFIVIAMVYVTLARGRLLGSSVRVHETQYPRVFAIVKRACAALEIPMPLVFVREDNYVPVAALGFGEPYALVISTHWIEVFRDDELAFMIGRELGHIAAGHTRYLSLLSVNGNENPIISLIFGAWLRRCATTCDKVGLLCCGSLDAAVRAISVAAFHEFGRIIDLEAFAEQHAEIEADPVSRWGAWLGGEPYATSRIASLSHFIETHSYQAAEEWFLRERGEEPPALAAPGTTTVEDKDCAGWWRRAIAFGIDAVVVAAIIGSFTTTPFVPVGIGVSPDQPVRRRHASPSPSPTTAPTQAATQSPTMAPSLKPSPHSSGHGAPVVVPPRPSVAPATEPPRPTPESSEDADIDELATSTVANTVTRVGPITVDNDTGQLRIFGNALPMQSFRPNTSSGGYFWLCLYMFALVALSGQTFGMMITGLRVVDLNFRRPGLLRTLGRYAIVWLLPWLVIPLSLIWRRVLLQDRLTKTRLVKVERVIARATGSQ